MELIRFIDSSKTVGLFIFNIFWELANILDFATEDLSGIFWGCFCNLLKKKKIPALQINRLLLFLLKDHNWDPFYI